MIATGPAQIEALKSMDMSLTSVTHGTYREVNPRRRLAYTNVVDFIPGVKPYEVGTIVELHSAPGGVKLVVIEDAMHNKQWTDVEGRV